MTYGLLVINKALVEILSSYFPWEAQEMLEPKIGQPV
jgi:hypothetical protein